MRGDDGAVTWYHAQGETPVPGGVAAVLPHAPALREEIARDLATFCENPNVGDLILFGWSPWSDAAWSFAPERGAHGGIGLNETQGFVLLPPHTPLPAGTEHFIRPGALRQAALHQLGRAEAGACRTADETRTELRLMTYNVHGCSGMDGRVSPRRVAHVIRGQMPDIVALQEVDLGRRRSRGCVTCNRRRCPTPRRWRGSGYSRRRSSRPRKRWCPGTPSAAPGRPPSHK